MGDVTDVESRERPESKDEKATIERNLELLKIGLIDETPSWDLDKETNRALTAIGGGDTAGKGGKREIYLLLRYNTRTGKLEKPPEDFEIGEYSILRTFLINEGTARKNTTYRLDGTNRILLTYPADRIPIYAFTAAITGHGNELQGEEGPKILPERIVPGAPVNQVGAIEPWGKSRFARDTSGDRIMLKSIQKFNEAFGH